jgi:hypothetical protein
MLADAELPPELWAEAGMAAAYLRNVSPASNKAKTPWELFYGQQPDVSRLRAYGARAYSYVPKEKRTKLDNVSQRGTMVGCDTRSKGYRILLDGDYMDVIISRDVIFDESVIGQQSNTKADNKVGGHQQERPPLPFPTATTTTLHRAARRRRHIRPPGHRQQATMLLRARLQRHHQERHLAAAGTLGIRQLGAVAAGHGRGDDLSDGQQHVGAGRAAYWCSSHPYQVGVQGQEGRVRQRGEVQGTAGGQGLQAAGRRGL